MEDARNNSAWNHRWFATHRGSQTTALDLETARTETNFAFEKGANKDPYNESPWRYLLGVLREQGRVVNNREGALELLTNAKEKLGIVEAALDDSEDYDAESCYCMASAHIDLLEMTGDSESLLKAADIAQELGEKRDTIRKKYWELRVKELKAAALYQ
eukprot:CAMPEP_0118684614 /NCGR_PEP_ID=MMETSP0800-20121206/6755_1 /TAXON_ID=210618 ORGANISM="Striatella unipunctata, Strain CCMP2910" /NCGR_SAMPLE_ID=MMETSP0800 /ASSEMBLY_ACC=CAM_ASM_000638 /LENGTH=158 /DNA_ID=CAMNT_0006581367 /DNA_START=390 /DNA_END=866 /DNA_ORIENTATION=+